MSEIPSHPLSQALGTPSAEFDTPDAFDGASGLLFEQAMARAEGNRSKAAELLGLNRNTLARRLTELGNDS